MRPLPSVVSRVALAGLSLSLLLAPAAPAQVTFSAPDTVAGSSRDLVVADDDALLVAQSELSTATSVVHVRPPEGPFSERYRSPTSTSFDRLALGGAGGIALTQLSHDEQGVTVGALKDDTTGSFATRRNGTSQLIPVAFGTGLLAFEARPDGVWAYASGAPGVYDAGTKLHGDAGGNGLIAVAGSRAARYAAVVTHNDPAAATRVAHRLPDGTWATHQLPLAQRGNERVEVAVNASGVVAVVTVGSEQGSRTFALHRYVPGAGWSSSTLVTGSTGFSVALPEDAPVSVDPDGTVRAALVGDPPDAPALRSYAWRPQGDPEATTLPVGPVADGHFFVVRASAPAGHEVLLAQSIQPVTPDLPVRLLHRAAPAAAFTAQDVAIGTLHDPVTGFRTLAQAALSDAGLLAVTIDETSGGAESSGGTRVRRARLPLAPPVGITAAPKALTNDGTLTFAFAPIGEGAVADGFECRLDAAAWERCDSGTIAYAAADPAVARAAGTPVADGPHVFEVRAVLDDMEGETTEARFTLDRTAPVASFFDPPRASGRAANFAFRASEAGATFACRIDAAPYETCANPQAFTALAVGARTIGVKATDPAGNTGPEAVHAFVVEDGGNDDGGDGDGGATGDACPVPTDDDPFGPDAAATRAFGRAALRATAACTAWPAAVKDEACAVAGGKGSIDVRGPMKVQVMQPRACFAVVAAGSFVSTGPVRVNGLTFTFRPGGKATVNPRDGHVILKDTDRMYLGPGTWLPTGGRDFDWELPPGRPSTVTFPVEGKVPAGRQPSGGRVARWLGGLPLNTDLELGFTEDDEGSTVVRFSVTLPEAFDAGAPVRPGSRGRRGENGVSLEADVRTTNKVGPSGTITGSVAYARVGPLQLTKPAFGYDFSTRAVFVSATASYAKAVAPVLLRVSAAVVDGRLVKGSVGLDRLNRPLAYGVFLQAVDGRFDATEGQAVLGGTGRLTFGPELTNPLDPGDLDAHSIVTVTGDIEGGIDGEDHSYLKIEGKDGLVFNALPLPSGKAKWDATAGKVEVSGSYEQRLFGQFGADAKLEGTFEGLARSKRNFLGGFGQLYAPGQRARAQAYLGDDGAAFCATTDDDQLGKRFQQAAGGKAVPPKKAGWGVVRTRAGRVVWMGETCDIQKFVVGGVPRAAQAGGGSTFTVARDQDLVVLRLRSTDGTPPSATLTGPGGTRVLDASRTTLEERGLTVLPADDGATYVAVRDLRPGTWAVRATTGNLAGVDGAPVAPRLRGTVRVTGRTTARTARYRIDGLAPGERAELWEATPDGTTRPLGRIGRQGALRFTSLGRKGRRLLFVQTSGPDGQPRRTQDLGTYLDRPAPRPRPARRARATRRGSRLTVRFTGAPRMTWFVTANLTDRAATVRTTRTTASFAGVGPAVRGTVRIVGQAADGRTTTPVVVRVPAARRR